MYRETMCAHYVGLSDEEINLLIAQLTGGRPVAEPESPEEYSQQEFDYPEPGCLNRATNRRLPKVGCAGDRPHVRHGGRR